MPECIVDDAKRGELIYCEWDDGVQQYHAANYIEDDVDGKVLAYYLERVKGPKSRRKQWAVVSRNESQGHCMYPPKRMGPFDTLPQAKKGYFTFLALRPGLRGWP